MVKPATVYAGQKVSCSQYTAAVIGKKVIVEPLSGPVMSCPHDFKRDVNSLGTLECIAENLPKASKTYIFK